MSDDVIMSGKDTKAKKKARQEKRENEIEEREN